MSIFPGFNSREVKTGRIYRQSGTVVSVGPGRDL